MQSHAATVRGFFAVTLVSCVDELLVSITAVRRIYRLAVRAPGRRLLVFIFSGASDRGRVGCKASGRRAALECTAPPEMRISEQHQRRDVASVLQKPAPKCRRRRLLAGPRRLVPHYLLTKLAAALVLARRLPRLRRGPRPAARAPQGARHPPRRRIGRSPRYPNTPASAPPRLREAAPSAPHPLLRGRRRAKAPGRAAIRLNAQRSQPPRRKDVARASFSKLGDARAHGAGRV